MAKPRKHQDPRFQSAREIFAEGDFEPLRELIKLYQTSVILTDEQSRHPSVAAMMGNFDLIPTGDGRWKLELSIVRKLEVCRTALPYKWPQLRSTEIKATQDQRIEWRIQTWSLDASGNKVSTLGPLHKAPSLIPNGESERAELHAGDAANLS